MLKVFITLLLLVSLNTVQAKVTKIAGDVYRFQTEFHYSVFVLTGNGIVVTDPINAASAAQLKAEIAKMTDQPITHLVYSHSHDDHASGGAAFGEVPKVIAHENAPTQIDGVTPTQRFEDTLIFSQGSKTFELTYLGPGHSNDLIAMVIRPENVGFIVDAIGVKQLPYRDMPHTNIDDLINQMRKVEALDFKVLAGGHGEIGVKADATLVRVYLEELRVQVLSGLRAGKSVEDMINTITMSKYRSWGWVYDNWRPLNIQGMVRHLKEIGAVD